MSVDPGARDVRILRAAEDVLKHYTFKSSGRGRTRVTGGMKPYFVTVHADWSEGPRCTCPDHRKGRHGGYCKHIIAVLLKDETLRHQLLEVFL